jgi:hypothetical protein
VSLYINPINKVAYKTISLVIPFNN